MKLYSVKMMRLAAPAEWGEPRTQEFSRIYFRRAVLHFPAVGKAFVANAITDNGLQRYVELRDEESVIVALQQDFADWKQEEWWRDVPADDAEDVRAVFGDHSAVIDLTRVVDRAGICATSGEVWYSKA